MYTTKQAAEILDVSPRRVTALLKNGSIKGEKRSGVWFAEESSIAKRARTTSKTGGRPSFGSARSEHKFILHNREFPILEVVYNEKKNSFVKLGEIIDEERMPIGLASRRTGVKIWDFSGWWAGRGIPKKRVNLDRILMEAGVYVPEELIYRNLGLSLSDQYWICPVNSGLKWEEINFFSNDFESIAYQEGKISGAHPNNTSEGNLEKFWKVAGNNNRRLYKCGTGLNQEPFNEVVATALYKRLLEDNDFVKYDLAEVDNRIYSVCDNFLSDDEEYVPAYWVERLYVKKNHESTYTHYVNCCEKLGCEKVPEQLSKMIVCDDILANTDRHFRNFGIIRNVHTLGCRPAPIFDSGNSLWFNVSDSDLKTMQPDYKSKQFYESSAKQLLLVDDFSIIDESKLTGFAEEALSILNKNCFISNRLVKYEKYLEERLDRIINIARFS